MRLVVCFLSLLTVFGPAECGNVLVWFTEGSHWLNMRIVLDTLIDRGHNVTVLVPNISLYMKAKESDRFFYQPFNVSMDEQEMRDFIEEFVYFSVYETVKLTADSNESLQVWLHYSGYESGRPTSFCGMMIKADIWLIRTYWDFEFPEPFLPNFKYVGGLHCTPAKPLPKDTEEFVQSSGDDGIVVFSLGSLVKKMPKETSNMIASALAQIPQKVLWRYDGEKPDTLGENTRIYKWIPQNDLLGHPKTRAFITHGGTNSIYEAIYHGVPMVGIPLFGDQPDNLAHVKSKGAAVIMDNIKTTQPQELVDGLNAVINDPLYKENTVRLSRIHHDRPIKPLDEAVFWIEFVMRNKGAKHLRVEAHNLIWYQYHCLDVFAFLITILTVVLYAFYKMCKFFIMRCCFRSKRKSKKE
ncbi:hypothetical protein G5714_006376 [Onychostoma macrolepis]|uniref:UDP-glucuronosyltransferase n=1 Tax=Onychostoma macrolepis TaxID=369639 RepID=A0A7J6D3R1_9TELE|nr:hypothetical protein G5714_006376 [Onychostoma macrolepis]